MNEPWTLLETGEVMRIVSYSGKKYEATFLLAGKEDAGLYVRLQDKKLARFSPARLIWTSLERVSTGAALVLPGDDVLVQTRGGPEVLGKVTAIAPEAVTVKTAQGKTVEVPAANVVEGSFRLLFPASDLRPGDEFLVRSSSGRDYRGHAVTVERDRLTASLLAGGEPVSIRVEHLDLRSLYVLIPLPLFTGVSKAS